MALAAKKKVSMGAFGVAVQDDKAGQAIEAIDGHTVAGATW
jgi:hypothetical protein